MNLKRPLVFFFLFQILGITLAYDTNTLIKAVLLFTTILLVVFLLLGKKINKKFIIFLLIFGVISFARFLATKNYYDTINTKIIESKQNITGKVILRKNSKNTKYVVLKTKEYGNIIAYNVNDVKHGNLIKIYGRLNKNLRASNFGEFDSEIYYRSINISSNIYTTNIEILSDKKDVFLDLIFNIKQELNNRISLIFNERDYGIVKAMLTADKSSLDTNIENLFKNCGIAHILAISGLHLSILGLLLYNFLCKFIDKRKSALIAGIFIILYGILIDASVSSIRAITMLIIRFISLSINRSYDSKNTLSFVGIILLFIYPYLLFNSAFQFSFISIYALNFYDADIDKNSNAIHFNIFESVRLNLFLFPITVYYYFLFPIFSIFLNFLVIPLMTFVLGFSILAIIISFISITFALPFSNFVHFILELYIQLCTVIDKIPISRLLFGRPNCFYIILYLIMLVIILYLIKNNDFDQCIFKNIFLHKSKNNIVFLLFFTLLFIFNIKNIRYKKIYNLSLNFLNAGQGDAIIIEDIDKVYSIDGGSSSNKKFGENVYEKYFLAKAINKIDKCFITHPDSDHSSGIEYLLTNSKLVKINEVVLPYFAKERNEYKNLLLLAELNNTKVSYIDEEYQEANINCIYPLNDMKAPKKTNDHSLVLKYKLSDDISALFCGDISSEIENMILKQYGSGFEISNKEKTKNNTVENTEENTVENTNNNTLENNELINIENNLEYIVESNKRNEKINNKKNYEINTEMHNEISIFDFSDTDKNVILKENFSSLKSDIIKIAHHGSKYSSSDSFINAVSPQISVISYGRNNYGHPAKRVVETLENVEGNTVYHTYINGEMCILSIKDKPYIDRMLFFHGNKNILKYKNLYLYTTFSKK